MNCSATFAPLVMRVLLFAPAVNIAYSETMAELDDAAARMQYAFYTADARSIEEVLRLVEEFEVAPDLTAAKSYQLAYGNWKLSQLYLQPVSEERPRANARSLAAKAAHTCAHYAKAATEEDAALAEAYAIEAACRGFSAHARTGSSGCARSRALRRAQALAPDNPRVKLVEALCSWRATADPADLEQWRVVVESFEAAPPSRPGRPDWGHVEALTMLGEAYLQRGETVAARDMLERALVLAPDYRLAQQLLRAAATRPR